MLCIVPAWAGIPTRQRPCTCYELLNISPDEHDPQVIEEAALARAAHFRAYQITRESECNELLRALAQALITLLDPARRSAYDQTLGLAAGPAERPPPCDVVLVARRQSRARAGSRSLRVRAAGRGWGRWPVHR
jgi:hypothetical protein